jgi:hypothetical protein
MNPFIKNTTTTTNATNAKNTNAYINKIPDRWGKLEFSPSTDRDEKNTHNTSTTFNSDTHINDTFNNSNQSEYKKSNQSEYKKHSFLRFAAIIPSKVAEKKEFNLEKSLDDFPAL